MSKKPNILFLLNDHQAYYRHGWDSGPKVQRPNFDRVASEGVLFNRAYCASPLCGPTRRTLLTGLYPHNHGETHNDIGHPFAREVYLNTLAENGYRNYYYGKWHAGPGTAHDFHCEGFSYPSYNNPYTKPEYKEYLEKRGLPHFQVRIKKTLDPWKKGIVEGELYTSNKNWCNEHATGVMTTPKETHEAYFLANQACDKLRELAADESDRPFALRVDFWGPHFPYFAAPEFVDLYNPEEIPEYGSFRDDLKNKPEIYKVEPGLGLQVNNKLIQPSPLPWSEWQEVIAMSYAQTTMIDAAGGLVLDTLEELGLAEDTIVIWTTDHGDALASHGGHTDKASYMPEETIRIPMAMRFPVKVQPGQVREDLVCSIDVAPTLLDAAGASFSEEVDGRSLLSLVSEGESEWREDLMVETHGHYSHHIGRALLTDRYKYVANRGDMDELYDLQADPYELENLIDHPDCQERAVEMRRRLAAWQEKTGDPEEAIEGRTAVES